MNFIFKGIRYNNGVEKNEFEGIINVDRLIRREATFKILNIAIIYNAEEEYYYTVATCVNEKKVIETISVEEFEIHKNVIELRGAYIDYKEYEEGSEVNCTGTIYY